MPIPGDINIHVESCLKRSEKASGDAVNGNSDEDENDSIDVEGESYEEYEWAGQTRIRASSLLEGGFSISGRIPNYSRYLVTGLYVVVDPHICVAEMNKERVLCGGAENWYSSASLTSNSFPLNFKALNFGGTFVL